MNLDLAAAIAALNKTRDGCIQRLHQNEDFQTLRAIDRAMEYLPAPQDQQLSINGSPLKKGQAIEANPVSQLPTKLSQSAAALAVLEKHGSLSVTELLPFIRQHGAIIGGGDPELSLSSTLSRDKRFVSKKAAGKYVWALKSGNND